MYINQHHATLVPWMIFRTILKLNHSCFSKIRKIRTWSRPRDWSLTHISPYAEFSLQPRVKSFCQIYSVESRSIDSTGQNPLSYLLTEACFLFAKLIAASRFQGSSERSSVSPEKN